MRTRTALRINCVQENSRNCGPESAQAVLQDLGLSQALTVGPPSEAAQLGELSF
ncbi:hypothetical protein I79_023706 [Cricetulus griseus]|uniref:Uncharacterized protein n=1 Tax=Cricetulus griseus TaxID=10029 RepID=G3IIN3_CRIGR|nr:hypothetical protein I79_023706 [Cricetulus griseus]